ncbi:MAG: hypothetical protein JW951_03860 [Lentisphaerae bacterium]|nr:hypothetical protein [Lentisphaerota bacterium]
MEALIARLNAHGVRYLLIGGQAARLEGVPRYSMDWDFLVPPRDTGNIRRINAALGDELDLPLEPLGPHGENFVQTYQTRWGIVQFHLGAPGLDPFDQLESRAVSRTLPEGVQVRCISGADLLLSKKAAGRPSDSLDIEFLEEKQRAGLL